MRMNRGTIVLIAALLVVIVVVLVINNRQASAPGETPTPAETVGALLPITDASAIVRYEVRNNDTGAFTALTKDSGGAWNITATNAIAGRDPEQSLIDSTAGQLVAVQYSNTFTGDQLSTFGLDTPAYTVSVTISDGQAYFIYIGDKSPTSARYYAIVEQQSASAVVPESTTETSFSVEPGESIASQSNSTGNSLGAPDENVVGGVDLANVTAEAQSTPTFAGQSTAEATTETSFSVEPGESVATQEVGTNNSLGAPGENVVGGVDLADVTAEAQSTPSLAGQPTAEATAEATGEMLPESTVEATPNVVQNALVVLEGEQTIYLIPQTVFDTLTRWLTTPPYAAEATAMPTLVATESPMNVTEESTVDITAGGTLQPAPLLEEGASGDLIPEGTPVATQEMTEAP